MIDPLDKEINVDEIMQKIREEVKRRKKLPEQETFQEKDPLPSQPPLAHQFIHSNPANPPPPSRVNINVLPYYINYHGFLVQVREEEGLKGRIKSFLFKFIRFFAWWQEQINRALYQELMAQKVRMDERERWIQELHNQQMNRLIEELSERDKKVEDLNNRLAVLNQARDELSRELGDQRSKIGETESHLKSLLNQQSAHLRGELGERDKRIGEIDSKLSLLGQAQDKFSQALGNQETKINEMHQWVSNFKIELAGVSKKFDDKLQLTQQELSRLVVIQSAINQITEEIQTTKLEILDQQKKLAMFSEEYHLPDEIYVAFENQFRGTREEIKERLKVYLPYVHQTLKGEMPLLILDLGCGRGEWLELMKENGYIGKGVDINQIMVKQCQELGLDVIESDMLDYLKKQDPNSCSIVTGFHILEHLPIKRVISLFDETLRVLKIGGMAIFETPNPENLLVASCYFYLDPTHRHPLPSGLLSFLMESRGFKKIEIVRHHPNTFVQESQKTSPSVESLLSLFNKEQDYSVIACKE